MTDGDALLAAIIAHPAEDTPRLAYADWLEEHGQPERAEFIRDCVTVLSQHTDCPQRLRDLKGGRPVPLRCGTCDYCLARRRAEKFYARHPWIDAPSYAVCFEPTPLDGEMPTGPGLTLVVRRGFVASLRCTAADWLTHADAILRQHPIERVELSDRLEVVVAESELAADGVGPQYILRVGPEITAESLGSPSDLPRRYRRSSDSFDEFLELCHREQVPSPDIRRAIYDLFWPGVEIVEPPDIVELWLSGGVRQADVRQVDVAPGQQIEAGDLIALDEGGRAVRVTPMRGSGGRVTINGRVVAAADWRIDPAPPPSPRQ